MFEPVCSKKWEWFFQVDLTRVICYWVWGFIGRGEEDLPIGLSLKAYSHHMKGQTLGYKISLYVHTIFKSVKRQVS